MSSQGMPEGGDAGRVVGSASILRAVDVSVSYARQGWLRRIPTHLAVDRVSLDLRRGETLALVGESGCGKSTLARALVQLIRPDSGQVWLDTGAGAQDLCTLRGRALRERRRSVQMVFQDPYASLDPRLTAAAIVAEPLRCFRMGRTAALDRARVLLADVGLGDDAGNRYPHQFSGGQRQRIGLARALALEPDLLVLDEPVSALDVSVQVQILDLLRDLRSRLGLTYLFISHDLAVVRLLADRVAVMQAGRIVEEGDVEQVFAAPTHPYTQALLAAVPDPDRPAPWAAVTRDT
jgi:ABC-type glutathione transport system ATPase component